MRQCKICGHQLDVLWSDVDIFWDIMWRHVSELSMSCSLEVVAAVTVFIHDSTSTINFKLNNTSHHVLVLQVSTRPV